MSALRQKVRQQFAGKIKNLVFEGGGVWGIAYEGVLIELKDLGILDGVERVAGASAGAITAALLAVGYSPSELGAAIRKTDFKAFQDDDLGYARDTARLLTEYGWYKGEKFRKWIKNKIAGQVVELSARHGIANPVKNPNLKQLRAWQEKLARKGVHLPEFFAVASNLSTQARELYCAETEPKLLLHDAVRRSMSIPLFFACARGSSHKGVKDVLVDGGLTWNYPINVFDSTEYEPHADRAHAISYKAHPKHVFNSETMGFRLDTTGELKANIDDWTNEGKRIENILQYGLALVSFIRAVANKVHLHKNDWTRTVFVDVGEDIGFTDFELSREQQEFLSESGRDGVREYFKWRTSAKGQREVERIYRDMA